MTETALVGALWRRLVGLRARSPDKPRWITSDLAVWAAGERGSWQWLHSAGFRAAVDLRTNEERGVIDEAVPPGFALRCLPIRDGGAPPVSQLLEVSDWIVERIREGSRVVVGCREGRGRSALVACSTLMRLGYSPDAAYRFVRRGQPRIALSDVQVDVLEELNRSAEAY